MELTSRAHIEAYQAHGGGLRGEYIQANINSLYETVRYHKHDARIRNESYDMAARVTYVVHDVSRLVGFFDGCTKQIEDIPFEFRFMTYVDLLDAAGVIDAVAGKLTDFEELIHHRISRLPDAYTLKQRYREITGLGFAMEE